MDLLLGIDAGTTSVKAGLFEPNGRCLAVAREEYQLITPAADHAELDPEIYWQACIRTVRSVIAQSKADPKTIVALAVSSQGETTISLDKTGKPVYPALVWIDNRATEQAARLALRFSKQVYQKTGIPEIIPTWPACKIAWIKENEPEVFSRVHKFLLVQDFLIHRLTGRVVTDGSISCTTMYYDINQGGWWQEVLDEIGISPDQLPEIVPPGSSIGTVSTAAASLLGLSASTKVVTGGMDQSVGAIGAGNIQPGTVSETTGAALAIQVTIADPAIDKNKVVPVYQHSVPGKYLFIPVCPTAGMAFKWFRDVFGKEEIEKAASDGLDSYDLLTRLAETIPPGSDGLVMLPHLMGAFSPKPNPAARGSFTGFTLSHTRGHFVRALLEGVAFMLRRNLESVQKAGIEIREIRSTGGGARSRLWNQIKANVCDLPVVTLQNEDTGLLGDAILAGVAAGVFPSIEQGCADMVAVKEKINPTEDAKAYQKPYQMYCELDQTLDKVYRNFYQK
jgi:xylulokinase